MTFEYGVSWRTWELLPSITVGGLCKKWWWVAVGWLCFYVETSGGL